MTHSTTDASEMARIQKRSNTILAILAAIAFAFATAPAYSQAIITAGFDTRPDLADGGDTTALTLPSGKSAQQLVGLGVDIRDTGYFWWSDGTVTQGSGHYAYDLGRAQRFDVPFGKRVSQIAGMAIDETGEVYTYFNDFTVSIGDPFDLDSVDRPRPYLLPVGYDPRDIIGVGILDDDVALFFRDGSHHYTDISDYRNFTVTAPDYESSTFTLPVGFNTNNIAGMDFADSDGRLYTMFVTKQPFSNAQPVRYSQNTQSGGITQSHTRRTTHNGFTTTQHSSSIQSFTTRPHGATHQTFTTVNNGHAHHNANQGITISKGDWSVTLPSKD